MITGSATEGIRPVRVIPIYANLPVDFAARNSFKVSILRKLVHYLILWGSGDKRVWHGDMWKA